MHLKVFLILITLGLAIPSLSSARDPWPKKQRIKHMFVAEAEGANPQTMLKADGKRSDFSSFRCCAWDSNENRCIWKYLNDINMDNEAKARNVCQATTWRNKNGVVEVQPPYLKNNKNIQPGETRYDAYGYDWPIGEFLRGTNRNPGWDWASPIVYGSTYGKWYRDDRCNVTDGTPTLNMDGTRIKTEWMNDDPNSGKPKEGFRKGICDCEAQPWGDKNTWVHMNWGAKDCMGPPYAISGGWWGGLLGSLDMTRSSLDQQPLASVGMRLGYDGEGRPIKSGDPWVPDYEGPIYNKKTIDAQGYRERFYRQYVPALVREVQKRYPGKTLRAMTERDFVKDYLENDIDFHRESLNADGVNNYVYYGLDWTVMGWWQGFADYFWITNTQGLQGWRPLYYSVLAGLSQHTDGLTGFTDPIEFLPNEGKGNFLKFVSGYIGKDTRDTPGVWTLLRDTQVRKREWYYAGSSKPPDCGVTEHVWENFANSYSGKYGDYEFYLYRSEELDGSHTVPVKASELPTGTTSQLYSKDATVSLWVGLRDKDCKDIGGKTVGSSLYVGRKVAAGNRFMSFDIDDNYAYRFSGQPGVSYDFRIIYLDQGTEAFQLQYKDRQGNWVSKPIQKKGTNLWQEITLTVDDAVFANGASEGANAAMYPTDFRLDFADPTKSGNPITPTVIHFIEARGKGAQKIEDQRAKAQVSTNIIRNAGDKPEEGIFSVGLNQTITVMATLKDSQGKPIPNERIMVTYNTEWNLAKSAKTDGNGVAYVTISTANNLNSTGFLGAGSVTYKASSYSFQAYFPGSDNYQPSRNDARVWISNSTGPRDPNNTRLKVTGILPINAEGKVYINYEVYTNGNQRLYSKGEFFGKGEGFYADDPDAQTVSIFGGASDKYHATFNHVTLYGNRGSVPDKVQEVKIE